MYTFVSTSIFINGSTRILTPSFRSKNPHRYTIPYSNNNRMLKMQMPVSSSSATPVKDNDQPPNLPDVITLYGTPVSNYAARCRYLIYRKELHKTTPQIIDIANPSTLGGIKSETYLKLNPLGKMPLLFLPSSPSSIYESTVICEYLADKFFDSSSSLPSFLPESPEDKARSKIISSLLDIYISPLHPYMYKKDVVGPRDEAIKKMSSVFDAIEQALDDNGPYAIGKSPSIADCCLWGNWPFYDFMLPTFFNLDPTKDRPKLKKWRQFMATESEAAKTSYKEVFSGLEAWWDADRWVKLGIEALTSKPQSTV